jgi:hypothetical protein
MGSPSEESKSSGAGYVISQVPNTPEVDMGFEVDPGSFKEASQAGIPETGVVAALRDMAQAINLRELPSFPLVLNYIWVLRQYWIILAPR